MKTLDLIIKREYFDQILAGEKVQESREIRPTNADKFILKNKDGLIVVNDRGNTMPLKYDAIRFYVGGYGNKHDSALVKVESAYTLIITDYVKWPDGTPMQFETDADGNIIYYDVDEDGKFITDADGNYIRTDDTLKGCPIVIKDGRQGGLISEPITYEYKGQTWWREGIVYNLGKVMEKDIHTKK